MKRLFVFLMAVVLLVGAGNVCPLPAEDKAPPPPPAPKIVKARWYGQSFVYLQDSDGVRVACDPFNNQSNRFVIPDGLTADILMISNESDDHNNTEFFAGNPIIFRSSTGEGTNRGNGKIYKGILGSRTENLQNFSDKCMMYAFRLDEVNFLHLGDLGQSSLSAKQLERIGPVDVLFVPVGKNDKGKIIDQINPKVIVPVHYLTKLNVSQLYPLDSFLKSRKEKVVRHDSNEMTFERAKLPAERQVWVFETPKGKE